MLAGVAVRPISRRLVDGFSSRSRWFVAGALLPLDLSQREVRDVLEAFFTPQPAKPVTGKDMIRAMCYELDRANQRYEPWNPGSSTMPSRSLTAVASQLVRMAVPGFQSRHQPCPCQVL